MYKVINKETKMTSMTSLCFFNIHAECFYNIIAIRDGKIVWKHGPYLAEFQC